MSRYTDDLIADSYTTSKFLVVVRSALYDPTARLWPKDLRARMRIPMAYCRMVAGKAYYNDRLIIDPDDMDLHLQLIHRAYVSAPGGHPGRIKLLDLVNRTY
jgi:hypothetical protein